MTKTAQHSFLFRLWIKVRGLLAFTIVFTGLVVGIISLVLPNDKLYKGFVVNLLSKQLGKEVTIKKISGKWKGFGPKFIITDLLIKEEEEVAVSHATLDIHLIKYLVPNGSTGISLGINDISVDVERKNSGKIVLSESNNIKSGFSKKLEKLLATGTLSVKNLRFNLTDKVSKKTNQINTKITVQQTASKRAFAMYLDSKGLADSILVKSIANKTHDFMKQAQWYLQADKLSLTSLGELLQKNHLPNTFIDAKVWFSTQDGNIDEMMAQAELKDTLFGNGVDITGSANLVYKGDKSRWIAELSIDDIKTDSISQDNIKVHLKREDGFIYLNADVLDIHLLKAITQVVNISNKHFNEVDLKGKIKNVSIKYDVELRRIVDSDMFFDKLKVATKTGNLNNLSGSISLHKDQIRLLIDSDDGEAEFPGYIRGKVNWKKLILTAQTSMQDNDLDLKLKSIWCDCNDFILDGSARIGYDDDLMLDLTFAVYQARVSQLYKYWPSKVWKPKVLNFLDQALVSGIVDKGMILYHGWKSEAPFQKSKGVFITKSFLKGATVKYHQDWPVVKKFDAIVDTINTTLIVKSNNGKVLKANVDNVVATISNFKSPLLKVDIKAHGKDNYLLEFLKKSPMKTALNVLNQEMELKGWHKIVVDLSLPLNKTNAKVEPNGTIHFKNTDFKLGQFALKNLIGEMDFKGFALTLNDLKAQFLNQNVIVSGQIENQVNKTAKIEVQLNGKYDVSKFETILDMKLPAQGVSPWQFSISNQSSEIIKFTAESDLHGTQLKMPAPFEKPIAQIAPLSIACILPCLNSGWGVEYNNNLKANFNFNTIKNELKINQFSLGGSSEGFGGKVDVLDVDKWIEVLTANHDMGSSKKLPVNEVVLQVGKLIFMSRELNNVQLAIKENEENLVITVEAEAIKGTVKVAKNLSKKGIIVELEKLHWQEMETEVKKESITNVTHNYPALHIWIGDFIYDGIPLGEASIEVRPVIEGIKVEKLITQSDFMSLNINGTWVREEGDNGTSKFNIIMASKNLSKFLTAIGIQAPINKAGIVIDMQASWKDFPSRFEAKNINGSMRIEIGKGEVVDAKPGIGRVLGLFSLTNLPRRLILDFRDVFSKGLQFQSMEGDFVIENGEANTDSFTIETSSARMVVSGITNLVSQTYNQRIVIVPRVGRVLPTIGALTGGAVGAAAGLFVQGLFHKGLKDVGKIEYKVTGSWEEPEISIITTK